MQRPLLKLIRGIALFTVLLIAFTAAPGLTGGVPNCPEKCKEKSEETCVEPNRCQKYASCFDPAFGSACEQCNYQVSKCYGYDCAFPWGNLKAAECAWAPQS